jgi:Nitrate and nitrite sensing
MRPCAACRPPRRASYQPGAVRDLDALRASITDLGSIRAVVSSPAATVTRIIRIYTYNAIVPADTFSAAVGGAVSDARLQGSITTLAALLRVENDQSVQRAIMYAALSAQPPVLAPWDLVSLQQAASQQHSDLAAFNSLAGLAGQQLFARTVSGMEVDVAASMEIQAEQAAAERPSAPLRPDSGLDAAVWYRDMSTTIDDTRQVTGHLVSQVSSQAGTSRSHATRNLLLSGIATLIVLLVLLISAVLARPLRR